MKNGPTALIILDGFGYSDDKKYNAIAQASTPFLNFCYEKYPHTLLHASGYYVGLPDGYIGNSEVGHFTIGAGRIIKQFLTKWFDALDDGSFENNSVLITQLDHLIQTGGTLHILGLLSDAGVHAHEALMHATIRIALKKGIKNVMIHPFLDGRDVLPQSAYVYLTHLDSLIKEYNNSVHIGSLHGRFYAMDRDNHWDRTEKSYRVLTEPQNSVNQSWKAVLEHYYALGITDEFIPPTQLYDNCYIKNGDGIILCNIRPDRVRQLTASFVQPHFSHFITKPLILTFFITPLCYEEHLITTCLFPDIKITHTLKDVLADHGKSIFTIAETEKYAHVTYFFRGENEKQVSTEVRIMIPSLAVKSYNSIPEMSAHEITAAVLDSLNGSPDDFYLINYANADMVGHSGDFNATVKAVECLDIQLKKLYDVIVKKMNGTLYITSDHGKAEDMYDDIMHQPKTCHTVNKVPFIMVQQDLENKKTSLPLVQLSDIAPFILNNMNIPIPAQMK